MKVAHMKVIILSFTLKENIGEKLAFYYFETLSLYFSRCPGKSLKEVKRLMTAGIRKKLNAWISHELVVKIKTRNKLMSKFHTKR